jgi:hypothetical protein
MFAFDEDAGFSIRTRADVEEDLEPPRRRADDNPTRREPSAVDNPTRREPGSGGAAPSTPGPAGRNSALHKYGRALASGTLCVIRGSGHGDAIAEGIGEAAVVVDERNFDRLAAIASEVPLGSTFVVRLEDPSLCLGWMLRRVEEGARVIVETRALTALGARRILLGTHAGPTASSWLDAHPLCWLAQEDGDWAMVTA